MSEFTDDRRAQIVRLLTTRDDHLPEPVRRPDSAAGFVHSDPDHRETCPDCLANGRVLKTCETCGGGGTVRSPRHRDPYATETVMPFGFAVDRHESSRRRDREIAMLEQQTSPPKSEADLLAEANAHPYSWELERRRMYREFDYAALDRGLEQLRDADPAAYHLLHAAFVYAWLSELSATAEAAIERGLRFLSDLLPARLRAPAEQRPVVNMAARGRGADPRALAQRDDAVRRAIAEPGASAAIVAARFGLSVSQVNRIVAKAA